MLPSCGEMMNGAIHCARSSASGSVGWIAVAARPPRPRAASGPAGGAPRSVAAEVAVEPVRVDDVRVGRDRRVIASPRRRARSPTPPPAMRAAALAEIDAAAPAAVILNRSVRPDRRARVELDVVELRAAGRHRELPRLAAVGRLVEAAVVAVVDDVRCSPDRSTGRDDRRACPARTGANVLPPSVETLSGTPRM